MYSAGLCKLDELVSGCIIINGAGSFDSIVERGNENTPATKEKEKISRTSSTSTWWSMVQEKMTLFQKKTALYLSFYYTQQPLRIKQVLNQVYTNDAKNVDDALVESIRYPSLFSDAPEVFYRVVTGDKSKTINTILKELAQQGSSSSKGVSS